MLPARMTTTPAVQNIKKNNLKIFYFYKNYLFLLLIKKCLFKKLLKFVCLHCGFLITLFRINSVQTFHFVCIVYADSLSRRFKFENFWRVNTFNHVTVAIFAAVLRSVSYTNFNAFFCAFVSYIIISAYLSKRLRSCICRTRRVITC